MGGADRHPPTSVRTEHHAALLGDPFADARGVRRLRRLVDEHDSLGGRPKALLMLTHPGPSVLVTALTVAAAGLARSAIPSPALALQLTALMLPAQLAIGAVNDLADRDADRRAKPHKPLVRGAVSPAAALAVAVAGPLLALAAAASIGVTEVLVVIVGLGAGLAYDLGLKRTPLSWLAWWAGFAALPLAAFVAAGVSPSALEWVLVLAAPLSLCLHCANALGDLGADAAAGIRSTPVTLGPRSSLVTMAIAGSLTAVLAVTLPPHRSTGAFLAAAAALLAAASLLGAAAPGRLVASRLAAARFPILALAAAIITVAWLADLPR